MRKRMYGKFKRNIIIITLLISFIPLAFLGYTIYNSFANDSYKNSEEQMVTRVKLCAQSLNLFLEEREAILSAIVRSGSLVYYNNRNHLKTLFDNINTQTGGGLVDIGVINSHGIHLAYVGPYKLEGLNYSKQGWFNQVMIKGVYISDIYMGYRGLPHFVIAVKSNTMDDDDWILRATIDPDIFTGLINTAHAGKTGDAFIINSAGIYQSPTRFNKGKILTDSGINPDKFSKSDVTVLKKNMGSNKKLFYAGQWIKNKTWLLIVCQNPDENMYSFATMRTGEIIIFFIAICTIVATTIITTDVSVKKLQDRDEKIDEMNAQLIQSDKLAALGKMAAGVAHEINNPLGIISAKAGWMKDLLDEEEFQGSENYNEYLESLKKIEEHVERAAKVTHSMLGFARSMEPAHEKLNINDVLNNTIEFVNHHAVSNNVKIHSEYDRNIPDIMSDRSQLQQVFLNIMNNAIDAIDKQGDIYVTTKQNKDHLTVKIKDTGKGIPDYLISKIFDPFFTTKEKGKGTGLGLSITHQIIEKLGGHIFVKSREREGTTFTIELPVRTV